MDRKELREQYEKETGEKAVDKSTGHPIPTWSYAEWLEQRIAALSAPAPAGDDYETWRRSNPDGEYGDYVRYLQDELRKVRAAPGKE
jgi:hypothetical protein